MTGTATQSGIQDTSQGQCTAAANQRGEHIPCDLAADHNGWAHSNTTHQLIWS